MAHNQNYKLKFAVVFVLLIITIVLGIGYQIFALRPPTTQPPTGGGLIGINPSAPNNSLYINASGNIGIGTTTPSKKLTVAGDLSFAGNLNLGGYVLSCELGIDCDGDGYTVWAGDCDESCSTCYPGSTSYTSSPDGKDQNCNGVIDEYSMLDCVWQDGGIVYLGYDSNCNWVENGTYPYTITGSMPTAYPKSCETCYAPSCTQGCDYGSCGAATGREMTLGSDTITCAGSLWASSWVKQTGGTLKYWFCNGGSCSKTMGYK